MAKIALVTGANQGLGLAIVKNLCRTLEVGSTVYLTARNRQRGEQAVREINEKQNHLLFELLDVTDEQSIKDVADTIKARHDGIDIVISNAAARITKDSPLAEQVRQFIITNNFGTSLMLKYFMPILNNGARFVTVASTFGSLTHLSENLHFHFDPEGKTFDDIDRVMQHYVEVVEAGRASEEGWPEWINIPSKIGQVALARIAMDTINKERANANILINAACPGLVDTDASRPWFDNMDDAQSPDQAAIDVVWLATLPEESVEPQGELVQFRKVIE